MSTLPPEDPNGGTPPPPPPPPGGAYGQYGEPYGGGAYGGPPPPPAGPGGDAWSVGDALSYGWSKFQANVGQIIIAALILLVVGVVAEAIGIVIRLALVHPAKCEFSSTAGSLHCSNGSGFFVSLLASAVMSALFFAGAQIIGAMIIRGALDVTEGQSFQVSGLFARLDLGKVVVASLITSAIVFVGTILCYLPGVIAAFMLSYTLFFVVDKGLEPVDAIKASFNLVKDNLGNTVLWYIVGAVVALLGVCLCLVGTLVTFPVVLLGSAYTYKKLTGQAVAA